MAITKVSDVVNAASMKAFITFFNKAYWDNSPFLRSGIVTTDPAIQARVSAAGTGGKFVAMPFWGDLDGDEETLNDTTDLTVNSIAAKQDVAVITRRAKAFGITDLAVDLAGNDPLGWIATRLAEYWARRDEAKLISTLKGVFSTTTGAAGINNTVDLSSATMNYKTILTAAQVLGDHKGELVGVAMNSAVESFLAGLDAASTLYRPSQQAGILSTYAGKSIVMDDNLGYNSTSATVDGLAAGCAEIYLFARGAVAMADAPTKVPFETSRDPLVAGGQEYVVSRRAGIHHIRGCAWAKEGTIDNPTNTQLATAANWTKVYDTKDIRVVKAIVKIG